MTEIKTFIILSFLFCAVLIAQIQVPELKYYANDLTYTLSPDELKTLNRHLETFEDTTSNQLVFLMIKTLGDYPLEMFSYDVAEKNKIGTKENDNGILFLVVKEDRKSRIEVGYGLEGALPDALSSSILRNEVSPFFRKGDFYGGVSAGIQAIMAATRGEYKKDPSDNENDNKFPWGILVLILFLIIMSRSKKRKGPGGFIFTGLPGGGGSSGGMFGGGSGGGFGGFSGGGGSFGGGGASGSW